METVTITQAELLEALAASAPGAGPIEARTVQELVQETGQSITAVRDALKHLNREGRLGVHKVVRRALDGRQRIVPGYTIKPVSRKRKGS